MMNRPRAGASFAAVACALVLAACTQAPEASGPSPSTPSATSTPSAPAPTEASADAQEGTENSIGMRFVQILAGSFQMGAPADADWAAPAETPQHEVTLTRDYAIGMFEVTQSQWAEVMGSDANDLERSNSFGDGPGMAERITGDDQPATVSWEDAQEFVDRINELEGTDAYRLPTETEWENAARAGTTTK